VSQLVVNSLKGPPQFKKPNFNLSYLIEMGNFMVGEQQLVQNSLLVEEYNRGLYSRKLTPLSAAVEISNSPNNIPNDSQSTSSSNGYYKAYSSEPNSHLTLETQEMVRQMLSQGHKIGIEHVDERRFRTGSWQSCAIVEINGESDAISILEACLSDYSGEYVRLVGIDPKAKKRIMETIIQRPNGKNH
jgi:ribulose bisphosphate carboxylase small subunit